MSKEVKTKIVKAFFLKILWWIWSILTTVISFVISMLWGTVIMVWAAIIIVIYVLLNFFFQPLIPYNRENVFYESFMVSKHQDYYKDFVDNYKKVCWQNFYTELEKSTKEDNGLNIWQITYTWNKQICKNPVNLVKYYGYKLDWKKQLLYWRTIQEISKQLNQIYIFKNFISWKYKLTRINTNKMKLVWTNKNNDGGDIIDIYNPFLLDKSWIFIENEPAWIELKNKDNKIVNINEKRYNFFFDVNWENSLFSKLYDQYDFNVYWVEQEKYNDKWKYKILIPPSIKNDYKQKKEYIKDWKQMHSEVLYSVYNQLEKTYSKMKEYWIPKKITICSDKQLQIPYYIQYKDKNIEKYNEYWIVCFTFSNVYNNKLTSKNNWLTSSFIVKLWESPDIDVELNLYSLPYFYEHFIKKQDTKIQKKFLSHFKWDLLSSYQYYYLLQWYFRGIRFTDDKDEFIYKPEDYTYIEKYKDFWKNQITAITTRGMNYVYSLTMLKNSNVDRQENWERWYYQPFIKENYYFNYLNNLIFNIPNKPIIDDIWNNPQFLFNFWNEYDKNARNFYYWFKIKNIIEREENSYSTLWWFFSQSDKLKIDKLFNVDESNHYANASIYDYFREKDIPTLKWDNALSLSLFDSTQQVKQIWINPIFIFFQNKKIEKKQYQAIQKYYKTEFENINYMFDFAKFEKINKDISSLLNNEYIKSMFDANDSNNFDFTNPKALAWLYPNLDTDTKIAMIANYINWWWDIPDKNIASLKDVSDYQKKTIYITMKILQDNNYLKDNGCDIDYEKALDFLLSKKDNITFYKSNMWAEFWNNFLCYFWNKNACKIQKQVKMAKCQNAMFNVYSFIAATLKIKYHIAQILQFKNTNYLQDFTLLDIILNLDYLHQNSYLYSSNKMAFANEFLWNDYLIIKWINIFDKEKVNEYKNSLITVNYNFWKVTQELLDEIRNIDCEALLSWNNIEVNQWNINICEKGKKAIIKYLESGVSLSQAVDFLKKLQQSNQEAKIFQVLINYGIPGQCVWFVQQRYPEIDFGWNANQWCDNAAKKWRPVIYNVNDVFTWAVIVRDWGQYWHVAIIDKIEKKDDKILVNDMNWKWPFIETKHWMKLYHPNFKCYIKIR